MVIEGGARQRLPAHPSSVAQARRLVRDELIRSGQSDLVESAELLISEVVTNALVHAGTPIDVTAVVESAELRVEVADGSSHLPRARRYTKMASTGRGLQLLQQLADRWGVNPVADGKSVWFELTADRQATDSPASSEDSGAGTAVGTRDIADVVHVVLMNVPLLLHAAWREQVDAVLREHLLFRLEEDTAEEQLEVHAAAHDAMAVLEEHIPRPEVGRDPAALMAAAMEPTVSREQLTVSVPRQSVPHFQMLEQVLDDALALAGAGAFLTPPMQPELAALRRWICRQVREQSNGGAPTPWSMPTDVRAPAAAVPLSWDPREVTDADEPAIGADDTDRIVAVSGAAAELLGYRRAEDLVGRRLLDIIPPRYRQAHLAGFTLHLLIGRNPLLDRPVLVPALRADGSETRLELLVRARSTPEGRRLFIATLRAAP